MKPYGHTLASFVLGVVVALLVYRIAGEPISNPVYMLYNRADFLFQFIVMVTVGLYWLAGVVFFRKF
ncbi:MAG: hypothetical protein AAF708_17335 [Deinococcota bacterium]